MSCFRLISVLNEVFKWLYFLLLNSFVCGGKRFTDRKKKQFIIKAVWVEFLLFPLVDGTLINCLSGAAGHEYANLEVR